MLSQVGHYLLFVQSLLELHQDQGNWAHPSFLIKVKNLAEIPEDLINMFGVHTPIRLSSHFFGVHLGKDGVSVLWDILHGFLRLDIISSLRNLFNNTTKIKITLCIRVLLLFIMHIFCIPSQQPT